MTHYILEGHEPKPADPVTWKQWFQTADRTVAKTEIKPGLVVSTVFLGIDLSLNPDRPILFETEVFAARSDRTNLVQQRYATWAEAELGHQQIVEDYRVDDESRA